MIINITPEFVVNAIIGKGFGGYTDIDEMTKRGLAKFNGNQHNESWIWIKSELIKLPIFELTKLYKRF